MLGLGAYGAYHASTQLAIYMKVDPMNVNMAALIGAAVAVGALSYVGYGSIGRYDLSLA